jgi:hypothetical protein
MVLPVEKRQEPEREQPEHEAPGGEEPGRARETIRFGQGVYGHVKAVLGAFALAAFLGHVFHIGWHGFLLMLIGYWDEYVRPVTQAVSTALITTPLSWIGVHYEVPVLVRDYLSVGTILALSLARSYSTHKLVSWDRVRDTVSAWLIAIITWPLMFTFFLLMLVPIVLVRLIIWADWIWAAVRGRKRTHKAVTGAGPKWHRFYRTFAPLAYLLVLLLVNLWLPR